jgi:Signal transduction histidine kinase
MKTRFFKGLFLALLLGTFAIFGVISFNILPKSSFLFFGVGFILLFLLGNLVFLYFNSVKQSWEEIAQFNRQLTQLDFSIPVYLPTARELGNNLDSFEKLETALRFQFRQLSQERNQLRAILQNMREGVLVTDRQSRVKFANPALYEILPLKQRCENKFLLETLRNQDIQEAIEVSLETHSSVEKEIKIPSGAQDRNLIVYVTPIFELEGIQGTLSVFFDVTPLRRLENARKDFVANVSHELKTPLTSIRGYAETLRVGALGDTGVAPRFVQKIEESAIQLQNLIEDLLRLAEIESGRLQLNPEPLSLRQAVAIIQGNFEEAMEIKQQGFRAELPELWVQAEPAALKQILGNLIDNAHKYTPAHGSIEITAKSEGHSCRVTVADSGIGIDASDLPHVFERFYRVDKARSREAGGTGLGLAIVKHLVQTHGGQVEVRSIPGRGSQFSFTLPLASPPKI